MAPVGVSRERTAGWTRLTASDIVTTHPVALHGVVIRVTTTGGLASVYAGTDATAGRLIGSFTGTANVSNPVTFPQPIACEHGLYAELAGTVAELTLVYSPLVPPGLPTPGQGT